ncbi:MAG: hypothetical protein JW726_12045 [Anaerolineales bacterium]|nr:hypothetical protein [Anaerolineales bacterium]
MQRRNIIFMIVGAGIFLVVASGFWLATATPASAQCGSQASSCKNCHEVQGEMSVNNDGTAWHTSHAFGDFCYICHAGNNQATDKAEAHTGMLPPLSDVKASCIQCHPDDLQERAQVYATALGVEIGAEDTAPASDDSPAGSEQPAAVIAAPPVTEINLDDPNLIDYVQRYDEIVLGKKKVNWGNIILLGVIGLVVVGGGGLVIKNEKWLDFSALDKYPADVLAMLPAITSLNPRTRKALHKALKNPPELEKTLGLINTTEHDQKTGEKTQ